MAPKSPPVEMVPADAAKVDKMAFRQHYADSTRPVSFVTEAEVQAMANQARTMRDGEWNEPLFCSNDGVHLTIRRAP